MKIRKFIAGALLAVSLFLISSCGESGEAKDNGVTVSGLNVNYISVDQKSFKSEFYIGDEFSVGDLVVIGNMKDGSTKNISKKQYTVNSKAFDNTKTGTYRIDITFKDGDVVKTTYYRVNVFSILDSVDHLVGITAEGAQTTFNINTDFNSTGLKTTAKYFNPAAKSYSTKEVTPKVDSSKFDKTSVGNYEIVLSYVEEYKANGKSQTVDAKTFYIVTVVSTLSGISVNNSSLRYDAYSLGDDGTFNSFDTSKWEVYASFDGMSRTVKLASTDYTYRFNNKFTSDPTDSSYKNSYVVTFSYTYLDTTKTATQVIVMNPAKTPVAVLDPRVANLAALYEADYTVNSTFTIKAQVGGTVATDTDSNIEYPSTSAVQYVFNKRIKLQGNGSMSARSIEMNLTKDQTLTAFVLSDDSATAAIFGLYDKNGVVIDEFMIDGINLTKYTYKVPETGKYYIWGTGAVDVYYIAITA